MHIMDQTLSMQIRNPFSLDSFAEIQVLSRESHMRRKIHIAVRMGERARVSGELRRRRTRIKGIIKTTKITAITKFAVQG